MIDFNPFGETTDSQLFDWDDLKCRETEALHEVDFRYVESELGIQPDGLQRYGLPQDFNDLAEGTDPDKLIDFLKLQGQIQAGQEDGREEEGGTDAGLGPSSSKS